MQSSIEYEAQNGEFLEVESSGATYLLSTTWNQAWRVDISGNTTVNYNDYCPTGSGGEHTYTGCTNTAAAQIIYYYIEKQGLDLQLTLTAEDEYTSERTSEDLVIEIKADGSAPGTISFAEINSKLADYDLNSADDVAALMYACGVVQQADYGETGTSTAWQPEVFLRAGLASATTARLYWSSYYYVGDYDKNTGMTTVNDSTWEVIIDELQAGRVVGASIPGHAIIIDGYDEVNDKFHLNYGWGGYSDGWYTRGEMVDLEFDEFTFDLAIKAKNTFTVTDADLYGTGTLMRAMEQSAAAAGDNTINFSVQTAGELLTLSNYTSFAEGYTINNLNMDLLISDAISWSIACWAYVNGSGALSLNNMSGSIVVNTVRDRNYVFYGSFDESLNVELDGGIIFTGKYAVNGDYTAGGEAVLTALKTVQSNGNKVLNSWVVDAYDNATGAYAFYGDNAADKFEVVNGAISIGDVYMYGEDDVLSIRNHSLFYGAINMGGGNNTVTIDSTSTVYGNVINKTALNIVLLSETRSDAIFTVATSSLQHLQSYAKVTVDITEAVNGVYTLFYDSLLSATNYFNYLSVTVTGEGIEAHTLKISNNTASSDYAEIYSENNALKIIVKEQFSSQVNTNAKNFSYGGKYDSTLAGEIKVAVNGGSYKRFYGGNYVEKNRQFVDIADTADVRINNGTFSSVVAGGDHVVDGIVGRLGAITTVITGGTFNNNVAGGMCFDIAAGNASFAAASASDINLTIAGGSFAKRIFGGNISAKAAYSGKAEVTGDIYLTLDASAADITVSENIAAGSSGYGWVRGDVTVTLKKSVNHSFDMTGILSGGSEGAVYTTGSDGKRSATSYVDGERKLELAGYVGDFGGTLFMFETLAAFDYTAITFTNSKLSTGDISLWNIEYGSSIGGLQRNSFDGDTLDFDLTGWDGSAEWEVLSGTAESFADLADAAKVTLGTQTASWNGSAWVSSDYKLSVNEEDNTLVIAALA